MVARRIAFLLLLCAVATEAPAAVTASVDRNDVELNESFSLDVVIRPASDEEPDVSPLEKDFYVGRASKQTDSIFVNGRLESSVTWGFVLMPKRAGKLTIPPIRVGTEQTESLVVDVSEPDYAPPGEADVFVTSELDVDKTWVQAQTLLTIKIFRAVSVRQPALREPTFDGVESLVERVGDDRAYQAVIDGKAYDVIERVYAVYPQESGRLDISPARFEARVLRDGRITGRKVFDSESQSIEVLPIPAPPPDHPGAAWLPARDVSVLEDWSGDPDEMRAGEPLTRHVTITALGQLETQIPASEPPSVAGVNVYPDKPELSHRVEAGGIRGVRSDRYAIIGTAAGSVTLPPLELSWWNIQTEEWQVARLPERTIRILPSAEIPASAEPVAEPAAVAEAADAPEAPSPDSGGGGLWRRAAELLGAVWVLTLLGWWWTSRPASAPREPGPPPIHRQQARALKAARRAALSGDDAGVRKALLDWAALEWPEAPPRSVGALAARVSAPLADELRRLSNAAYGPAGADWDRQALARALRSFAVVDDGNRSADEPLPPLMPRS